MHNIVKKDSMITYADDILKKLYPNYLELPDDKQRQLYNELPHSINVNVEKRNNVAYGIQKLSYPSLEKQTMQTTSSDLISTTEVSTSMGDVSVQSHTEGRQLT